MTTTSATAGQAPVIGVRVDVAEATVFGRLVELDAGRAVVEEEEDDDALLVETVLLEVLGTVLVVADDDDDDDEGLDVDDEGNVVVVAPGSGI